LQDEGTPLFESEWSKQPKLQLVFDPGTSAEILVKRLHSQDDLHAGKLLTGWNAEKLLKNCRLEGKSKKMTTCTFLYKR